MRLSRRTFLKQAVRSAVGVGLLSNARATEPVRRVPLRVSTVGPGPIAVTRGTIVEKAARRLNQGFEGLRLDVHVDYWRGSWSDYDKKFILAFNANRAPDIRSAESSAIPWLASAGYILPLDAYIEANSETYADFLPLWEGVHWQGKRYAIPVEAVVRLLFYRRDVLEKLGLGSKEIPAGGLTWEAIRERSVDAKQAGLVQWGYLHRPNPGPYFHTATAAFGGRFIDTETGALILDRDALFRNLEWHYRAAHEWRILPEDMTSWSWRTIHKLVVEGQALFWAGHVGQWAEWQRVAYHKELGKLSRAYLEAHMGFTIWPRTTTLVNLHGYSLVSGSQHPDLAFDLITEATSPDLMAEHAVQACRLPVRQGARELLAFGHNPYLTEVASLVGSARPLPAHPDWDRYDRLVFDAITACEIGVFDPEQSLGFLIERARSEIPEAQAK